jgi:hypothetical protein
VPYRYGRWGYVAPWGWTWIDEAPWGFAPFHYGRWVFVGGGWGWVPGVIVPRPVFAPALVAWFGGPGLSVSINIGAPIGWFPLGPGEVFIPGYPCSHEHMVIVNRPYVANITNVTVINPPQHYAHGDRDRATWATGNALFSRGPINRVMTPPPADWQSFSPRPRPPIEPPRDIKKRPTPIPMPGRTTGAQPAPESPRAALPVPSPRVSEPNSTERSAPRPDESRSRRPHAPLPAEHAARTPAPIVPAPAAPSTPATPRVVTPGERRQSPPASNDAPARTRQPVPAVPARGEQAENRARTQEPERGRPRVTRPPPPASTSSAPAVSAPPHGRDAPRPTDERVQRDQRRLQAEADRSRHDAKPARVRE